MDDPLSNIEAQKAQTDIGVFMYRVYLGAKSEGASTFEAYLMVCAWAVGSFSDRPEKDDGEDG
jgi:hypothetical protein